MHLDVQALGDAVGRLQGDQCLPVDILTTTPNVYRWLATGRHSWLQVDIDVYRWQFGQRSKAR